MRKPGRTKGSLSDKKWSIIYVGDRVKHYEDFVGIVTNVVYSDIYAVNVEDPSDTRCYKNWELIVTEFSETPDFTDIRHECVREIGWALWYMDYQDLEYDWDEAQRDRVDILCREISINYYLDSMEYWRLMLKRIKDETENMC